MATVNMLRDGSVKAVEVPTIFSTEDDVRIWVAHVAARDMRAWDQTLVQPFVDAYNNGSTDLTLEVICNIINDYTSFNDPNYPITEVAVLAKIASAGLTLRD